MYAYWFKKCGYNLIIKARSTHQRAFEQEGKTMRSQNHFRRLALALTFSVAAVFAPAAYADDPLTPEGAAANIATVQAFYSLINGGDALSWRQIISDNWTATPALPLKPDETAGYEMVIGAFRAGIPDLTVEMIEIIANDDVVAVRSRVTGTNTAPLFGQPATNKPVSFTEMDIHRVQNGRIVETWHVEDFPGMNSQLSGK